MTLSLEELLEATQIGKEILLQVLAVLVKAKVLINEEPEQYDLNPSTFLLAQYILNYVLG